MTKKTFHSKDTENWSMPPDGYMSLPLLSPGKKYVGPELTFEDKWFHVGQRTAMIAYMLDDNFLGYLYKELYEYVSEWFE